MRHSLAGLLLALSLTAGCGNGGILQPTELSAIRIYNASPDSPPLNFYLRGGQLNSGLAYGFGRFYVFTAAGPATLDVQNSVGDILLDYPTTLAGGVAYTFAITGPIATPQAVFLVDDTTAALAGNFKARIIHLATQGPPVDVYVTPTTDISAATPLATGVTYTNASAYITAPAGTAHIQLTTSGTKTILRDVGAIPYTSGQGVSVFFIGKSGAGGGGAPYSSSVVADHS